MLKASFLCAALLLAAGTARAQALRRHRFLAGETLRYDYEDTDLSYQALPKDGTVQAGNAFDVQEIRLPVEITVSSDSGGLTRSLTLSAAADYREAPPSRLGDTPFKPIARLDAGIPSGFSYAYKSDSDALDRLQDIFADIRRSELGSFLFFKMEDVHQMLGSAATIPDGLLPGRTQLSPARRTQGLGGDFVAAAAHLLYVSTETFGGAPAAYFQVASLGHEFSLPGLKVYSDFTFSMHVALEGPEQGLLLFGEGQETATILKLGPERSPLPQVVLQRQFSIRLTQEKPSPQAIYRSLLGGPR